MKVRIYSPFLPYPVTEGAFRVILDQAHSLQALGHEVEWVTWRDSPSEFERKSGLWPAQGPSPGPGSVFLYWGPVEDFRALRILTSLGSEEASPEGYYYPKGLRKRWATLPSCDLAIYHYSFAWGWLRGTPVPGPEEKRRVVHFHNLESDLSDLQAQNSEGFAKWVHRRNSEKLKRHEAELLCLCDELWFLSPLDLRDFRERISTAAAAVNPPTALLRLVPPTFSALGPTPEKAAASMHGKDCVLGFIGGFHFQPNIDSAQWILQNLVPALEKAGFQGKLKIAGRGGQTVIRPRVRSPWVEVLPDHAEVDPFFADLSWMLVPHVSGSGVRIKLLDALSRRIPVMATRAAVERLHPEVQASPLIFSSDDAQVWARHLVEEEAPGARVRYRGLGLPRAMNGMEIYKKI